MLTLTLSEQTGRPAADLIDSLRCEIEHLQSDGGIPGLEGATRRWPLSFQTSAIPRGEHEVN